MSQYEHTINLGQENNEPAFQAEPQERRTDIGGDLEMTDNFVSQSRPTMAAQNQYPLPVSETPRAQMMHELNHLSRFESSDGSAEGAAHLSPSSNTNKGASPALQGAYALHSIERPDQSGSISQRSEKADFQDIFSELMTDSEHENAFLSRHYAEVIGPWYVLTRAGFTLSPLMSLQARSLRCREVLLRLRPNQGHQLPVAQIRHCSSSSKATWSRQWDKVRHSKRHLYLSCYNGDVSECGTG